MFLRRRPHQRGGAAQGVLRVHVGAVIEQDLDRVDVAGPRRHHEGRLAMRQDGHVRVGSGFQQLFDHRRVAVDAGQRQRSGALAVGGGHVCAGLNQQSCRLQVVAVHSPVQRRRTIGLRRIDVRALLQQRAQRRAVPFHDGIRDIAAGGAKADRGDDERRRADSDYAYHRHLSRLAQDSHSHRTWEEIAAEATAISPPQQPKSALRNYS